MIHEIQELTSRSRLKKHISLKTGIMQYELHGTRNFQFSFEHIYTCIYLRRDTEISFFFRLCNTHTDGGSTLVIAHIEVDIHIPFKAVSMFDRP